MPRKRRQATEIEVGHAARKNQRNQAESGEEEGSCRLISILISIFPK